MRSHLTVAPHLRSLNNASYAASSRGASCSQASVFLTRSRPICPLRVRSASSSRSSTTFRQVVLDDRLAERHILHDLVHRGLVVHLVCDVRIHAYVRRVEHREQYTVGNATGERHILVDVQLSGEALQRLELGTTPHQAE